MSARFMSSTHSACFVRLPGQLPGTTASSRCVEPGSSRVCATVRGLRTHPVPQAPQGAVDRRHRLRWLPASWPARCCSPDPLRTCRRRCFCREYAEG